MKKLILLVVSASFLVASAIYAGTTVVINNQLTTNHEACVNGDCWVSGDFSMQITPSSYWGSHFSSLPAGNTVISSAWPTDFLTAKIDDITGYDITKSRVGHDFISSPSCENINIVQNATNRILVTSGYISPYGVKERATICTVTYS